MKRPASSSLFVLLLLIAAAQAQSSQSIDQITRPRVVGTTETASTKTKSQEPTTARPTQSRTPETPAKTPAKSPVISQPQPQETRATVPDEGNRRLSPNRLRSRINEAQRLMKAHPMPTAMTPSLDYVTVAALLPENSQIHLILSRH